MRIDAYMQVNQIYQSSKPRTTAKTARTSASDSFEISSIAKDLQIAKQATSATTDVREDKVQDIKNRMQAGTYKVSIEDVAENLAARLIG